MLQAAIEDGEVVLGNFRSKNVFRPLMHFITKMNELITRCSPAAARAGVGVAAAKDGGDLLRGGAARH